MTDHVGPTREDEEAIPSDKKAAQLALFSLEQWQEAVYTRIVDKVGTRVYWDQWAADVADIATAQITRINAILESSDTDKKVVKQFDKFWKGLRDNLNDSISRDDAISMLSQHLITKPIFDALFAGHDFATQNPVSQVMQAMADALDGSGLEAETKRLAKFYDSVRLRAEQVVGAQGKQHLIADLYQKFFQTAFKKQSDALGIVYTPVELVDFILRAADHAAREHLGRGLTDEGVHILDGFTGTGTFITRLLESDLITPKDLSRKYNAELHANEIMLLAYYIAAVNIETTYHALAGKSADADDYEPFPGIVLADTFQISEEDDALDFDVFAANNDRIAAELDAPISVIIGNPPYSAGQASANDNNANTLYPTLDDKIRTTYLKDRKKGGSQSLFDSYIRAFRWATDRIGDSGIVAFISNGGWIDGSTANGMRLTLADEYSHIYIYNLRGNSRTTGDVAKREGGNVFNVRVGVSIFIGIKDPQSAGPCKILYSEMLDGQTRDEKLARLTDDRLDAIEWTAIKPNDEADWINQRSDDFVAWPAIGDKKNSHPIACFGNYAYALLTARDAWVYNFSRLELASNVRQTIDFYNSEVDRLENAPAAGVSTPVKDAVSFDSSQISWTLCLLTKAERRQRLRYAPAHVTLSTYRPFCRQNLYFDRDLNRSVGQLPSMFPTPQHANIAIATTGPGAAMDFAVLMVGLVPDLSIFGSQTNNQTYSRWTYEKVETDDVGFDFGSAQVGVDEQGYRRVDNVTDGILKVYREAVGEQVSKDDIFYFVYGQLHDPDYRNKYAADLKKMLPHIPTPDSAERFNAVADIGRQLADLHLNYEEVEPYPLDVQLRSGASASNRETWRVEKMKWKSKTDRSAIIYNAVVTIAGIPDAAHNYMLGSRTALEWLIDRYQVKSDKASGIVNDPNDWCDEHDDPTYIVDLIKKVTTVSVRTVELVGQLTP